MPEDFWAARNYGLSRWFVVHAQPHRELKAHAHLNNQGFHSFLPLHKKTVRHARQFRTTVAPLFPRYLFVELTVGVDSWYRISGTVGVSRLIMEGDRPKAVAPGVVEAIIAATDASGLLSLDVSILPGQSVRIVTGAFNGLVGKLIKLDDNGRVQVLLDLLGSKVIASTTREGLVPAA
jgi:transcription antitermination factor NusG